LSLTIFTHFLCFRTVDAGYLNKVTISQIRQFAIEAGFQIDYEERYWLSNEPEAPFASIFSGRPYHLSVFSETEASGQLACRPDIVRRQKIERLPHPDIALERHEALCRFGLTIRDGVTRGRTDRNTRSLGDVGDKADRRAEGLPTGSTPMRRTPGRSAARRETRP
jgi:hypothetical protein